jgi:Fe-S oxidoreductase
LSNYEVIHHSEFILELIKEGKIIPTKKMPARITYHDSCYLGRFNNIYKAPREIIKAVGGNLVEMEETKDRSFCCGAGGGHMWQELELDEKLNHLRIDQASKLTPDIVAPACSFCMIMLDDAVKTKK